MRKSMNNLIYLRILIIYEYYYYLCDFFIIFGKYQLIFYMDSYERGFIFKIAYNLSFSLEFYKFYKN